MKKITSVLLTVVMLASMLSATALAVPGGACVEAAASVNYESGIVTVAFTAVQPTTNGRIAVEYDADSLTYVDCDAAGTASSVSQSAGSVTFGYGTSTPDAIRAGGEVAVLTLRVRPNASGITYLNVNVEEFNGMSGSVEELSLMVDLSASSFIPTPSRPDPIPAPSPAPGGAAGGGTAGGGAEQPDEPPVTGPVTTGDVVQEGEVVTETTAVIESATEGGTASAAVSQEIAEEIVNQAVRNGSDTVVIAPDMGGGVNEAVVTIPAGLVSDLAEKTGADLRVETPVADVTISHEGLNGLAAAGGAVTVSVGRDGDTVSVSVSVNGQPVGQVPGGVTVNIPQAGCTPGTVAMLVHEDGSTEIIRWSVVSSDGRSITVPLDGSATIVIVDNSVPLSDVPATSWAAGAVAFVTSHELMKGTGDGIFEPNLPMTRGMLALVLHNLENNAAAAGGASFSDVADGAWYAEAVAWASAKGIIAGYADGRFGPNDPITREQLAVMLYRYAGSPAVSANGLNFVDAGAISGYAQQAIAWAVANGVMSGKGGGVLDPQGNATRAEVAQMLLNFVSSMA